MPWSSCSSAPRLPSGVAYGSDAARVRAALLEAASTHPDVLRDPRPRVEFKSFGDSALHFELLVWTRNPAHQFRLISDLNYRVEASLRRHRIGIPFPQRDLHLRSPQLEQLLNAWSRRHFTEAELSAPNGHGMQATRSDTFTMPAFDDDLEARSWSDEQIDALITRMRGSDGVTEENARRAAAAPESSGLG
jgi:potassium efflux system protein